MDTTLTQIEARVLGVLVEKEVTTPEYYPLSINALTNGCNQKLNRDPVVSYDEKDVVRAVESLRDKHLTLMVTGAGSRVAKYKHTFARRFQLNDAEVATLCILMLRGAQTVGEIRGRTSRLYDFESLHEVEQTLKNLMTRGEGAYVVQLPRQTGMKEFRYMHLLCGEPEIPPDEPSSSKFATEQKGQDDSLYQQLAVEIEELRTELFDLRNQFAAFKKEFE